MSRDSSPSSVPHDPTGIRGILHLVPAGRPIDTTACGLQVETPDRPWREGLVPDRNWSGPLGPITCPACLDWEAENDD